MQIVDILKAAQQQNSSDIHIEPGNPVMLRIDGMLVPQGNQVLTNVAVSYTHLDVYKRQLIIQRTAVLERWGME